MTFKESYMIVTDLMFYHDVDDDDDGDEINTSAPVICNYLMQRYYVSVFSYRINPKYGMVS
jgi:hypothetical protein